jgi:hypothetical protein
VTTLSLLDLRLIIARPNSVKEKKNLIFGI